MQTIRGTTGWDEFDSLDNAEIRNGERLRVKFPNGAIVALSATVPKADQWRFDIDGPYKQQIRRAYLKQSWNGAIADIPLRGLLAERIKD